MRKIVLIIALFPQICFTLLCKGQSVTLNEAKTVANTYLDRPSLQSENCVARVNTESDSLGNPLMYEVIMNDSTIVLVSGSKATTPILATYECANGLGILETDVLPCGLEVMMNFYRQTLAFIAENNEHAENNEEWQQLLNGERPHSQGTSVNPLLTTQWGQGCSNDSTEEYAYNKFTPSGTGCQHCLAGCVAVSMGQVMNYYKHPIVTYATMDFSEQFDWCHMPDRLVHTSPLFDHECEAISRLLFTCGDVIGMQYGCDSSGSTNTIARQALINYFGYSSSAKIISRQHTIPWFNLYPFLDTIKLSLDRGYPVIMGAKEKKSGGMHSFVCDGYNGSRYHFNWGWIGQYNGFYSFNFWGNINVGNYTFSQDFDAIVFLHPDASTANDICNNEMHLEEFYLNYYQGHLPAVFKPYDNTPKTMSVLYSADISSSEDWRTIPRYARNVEYRAYRDIYLQDGFTAKPGCEFTATIDPCAACETRDGEVVVEEYRADAHDAGNRNNGREAMYDTPSPHVEPLADLHPNPASGEVSVTMEDEVQGIILYNAQGQPVGGWKMLSLAGNNATLDISALPAGPYLVRIATPRGTVTKKLVVRRR